MFPFKASLPHLSHRTCDPAVLKPPRMVGDGVSCHFVSCGHTGLGLTLWHTHMWTACPGKHGLPPGERSLTTAGGPGRREYRITGGREAGSEALRSAVGKVGGHARRRPFENQLLLELIFTPFGDLLGPGEVWPQGKQESSTAGHWNTDTAPPWRLVSAETSTWAGRSDSVDGTQSHRGKQYQKEAVNGSLRYPWRPPEDTSRPREASRALWGRRWGRAVHFSGCHAPLLKVCSPCETVNTPKQEPTFNEQLFHAGHS